MTLDIENAKKECKNYHFSLLTCNVQSFNKNSEAIKSLIYTLNPSIINLQEIWQPKISMQMENYHVPITHLRTSKRGGGHFNYD